MKVVQTEPRLTFENGKFHIDKLLSNNEEVIAYVSHDTPVAFTYKNTTFITDKVYSTSTSRHRNKYVPYTGKIKHEPFVSLAMELGLYDFYTNARK